MDRKEVMAEDAWHTVGVRFAIQSPLVSLSFRSWGRNSVSLKVSRAVSTEKSSPRRDRVLGLHPVHTAQPSHTLKYYAARKRTGILTSALTWMAC